MIDNTEALGRIETMIRHGFRMSLAQFMVLKDAGMYGFAIEARVDAHYNHRGVAFKSDGSVYIRLSPYPKRRPLFVKEKRYAERLVQTGFDHWGKRSNDCWYHTRDVNLDCPGLVTVAPWGQP